VRASDVQADPIPPGTDSTSHPDYGLIDGKMPEAARNASAV
jgi:hypothetical protein